VAEAAIAPRMRQWALRRRTCLASTSIDTEKTGNFDQERPSFMPPIAKHISQSNVSSQPPRPCECDRLQGCGHRDDQGQEQQMQSPQRGTNFPLSSCQPTPSCFCIWARRFFLQPIFAFVGVILCLFSVFAASALSQPTN